MFKTYLIVTVIIVKNWKRLLTGVLRSINGAYDIYHMTVIYMLIWVLN